MTIRVRYFASLREKMGRVEDTLVVEGIATVSDVWRVVSTGQPLPEQLLCAVNMEYAEPASPVRDGDEVAFFPPVTGGCR
jgi:molybdopterin synthase sulfur carrier subunit